MQYSLGEFLFIMLKLYHNLYKFSEVSHMYFYPMFIPAINVKIYCFHIYVSEKQTCLSDNLTEP